MNRTHFWLSVMAAVILSSCRDSKAPEIAVTSVQLSQNELTLVEGKSVTLMALITPPNATEQIIMWTSSNTSVVVVDQNGTVSGLKAGAATVTATCGGKNAVCMVHVLKESIPVTSIELVPSKLNMRINEKRQLGLTLSPSDATDVILTWISSDPGVATVNEGLVTAVSEGVTTIIVSAGSVSASCIVTVSNSTTGNNEGTSDANWD